MPDTISSMVSPGTFVSKHILAIRRCHRMRVSGTSGCHPPSRRRDSGGSTRRGSGGIGRLGSLAASSGGRDDFEDEQPLAALFCVFDGHCGRLAAEQAAKLLPRELADRIDPRQLLQV